MTGEHGEGRWRLVSGEEEDWSLEQRGGRLETSEQEGRNLEVGVQGGTRGC